MSKIWRVLFFWWDVVWRIGKNVEGKRRELLWGTYNVRVAESDAENIVQQGIKPVWKSATWIVKISNTASLWVAAKNSLVQIPA